MTPPAERIPRILAPRPVPRPWGGNGVAALGLRGTPGEPIGEWWLPTDEFPLLVKIIDARENLSIQLHPDDELARAMGHQNGKTEAWYILAAEPDARILIGLADGIDAATLLDHAERGADVSRLLRSVVPQPGDVVFVPPGTVHAICAGVVLLEVQQVSDITFRIYDWNRRPARQLHLAEARRALASHPHAGLQPRERDAATADARTLVHCDHFGLAEWTVGDTATIRLRDDRPELWFCRTGEAHISIGTAALPAPVGSFILLPPGATVTVRADGPAVTLIRMTPP